MTAAGSPRIFFTKEIAIIILQVITDIFLTINVVFFVNFPNVVHVGFDNKERQPE